MVGIDVLLGDTFTNNTIILRLSLTASLKTYVNYGCWFWPFVMWSHNTHSNIFIRLGNFFRGEHYVIQNKFGLPGGSDKVPITMTSNLLRFRL